jgi:ketosteroid isomerase-like protein
METKNGRDRAVTRSPDASDFIVRFADAWAHPDLHKHRALWHPDVRLVQPMAPTAEGMDACLEQLSGIFRLIPDLRAEVHAGEASPTQAFIEFTLKGTFAGRPIAWQAVDRFTLADGLIVERVSYFDSLPLVLTMLRHPTGWWHWLKARPRR